MPLPPVAENILEDNKTQAAYNNQQHDRNVDHHVVGENGERAERGFPAENVNTRVAIG